MPTLVVLGVDPGFSNFGYALLRPKKGSPGEKKRRNSPLEVFKLGVFRTKKAHKKERVLATLDNVVRARELASRLEDLVDSVEPAGRVALICAEAMSFPRSSSVAAKMAMSWGILVSLAERRDITLLQISPKELKRRATGYALADKETVQRAMSKRFGNLEARLLRRGVTRSFHEHPFDAVAAAVACLDSDEGQVLLRQST